MAQRQAEAFICGAYDRGEKRLRKLSFVVTAKEEAYQRYTEGDIIYVGNRVYKLGTRREVNETVIEYDLNLIKGKTKEA